MAHFSNRDKARDGSRPSTPTGPSRAYGTSASMRALDTRLKQPETFFDDATPVDSARSGERPHDALRDSHDLSFADGTRDSVVDNMLLSLDQLPALSSYPAALYSNFDDDNNFFLADNAYPPQKAPRHRGHTYASSHSSDYDLHADDSTSRFPTHPARGRRSNSSNNIPSNMSRRESLRGVWPGTRQPSEEFQQAGHMRGGKKGSKSSAASSVDFGKGAMGAQRVGLGRRSISFDHGNMTSKALSVKTESILERNRPAYTGFHADYEAAPQPTVPAGPRRTQEPQSPAAYPPKPSYAPPQAPAPRRKNSVRSTTSYKTLRKNKSHQEPNMRQQAQEFVNASNLRDLPPIPTYQDPPAPSPTVATRKHTLVPLAPVPTPKEKPGFFRRVFGGGLPKSMPQLSNSSTNSNNSRIAPSPASSTNRPADVDSMYSHGRPRTTPHGSSHIASQLKSPPPRPPQTANSAQANTQQTTQPTLAKKHSSFFRRRKKSVTEAPQQPVMPLQFQNAQKLEDLQPQQSPGVSSLRKVMNPYLGDVGSPEKTYRDVRELTSEATDKTDGERQNGFSPGYKPHKDATVRSVKPGSRETNDTTPPPSSRQEQLMAEHAASTNSPKLKLKMKPRKTNVANMQEDTFLADSSSCNEDRSGRATPSDELGAFGDADETPRATSSPTAGGFPLPPNAKENKSERSGKTRNKSLRPAADNGKVASTSPSQLTSEGKMEEDGWVVTTASKQDKVPTAKGNTSRSKRVWLEPTSSEERLAGDEAEDLTLPLEGARSAQKPLEKEQPAAPPEREPSEREPSSANDLARSTGSLPTVQVETQNSEVMPAIVEHRVRDNEPTDADRARAFRIFSGDDPSVQKGQAAADLGDVTASSTRTRKAFMELFDWTGFNVLGAMRDLCGRLVLKAETQQVDRILMSLSERWCECNPNHGFKAIDVVHTICYSILLLNTDLHVADIESRMTRSQFVKNTLPTVVRVCKDALKDAAEETLRPQSTQFRRGSLPWNNPWNNDRSEPSSPAAEHAAFPADAVEEPVDNRRARSRLSLRPSPMRSGSEGVLHDSAVSESNLLVGSPYNGPMKGWEFHVETVLKEFYDSIRKQRLPLHGASTLQVHDQPSTNNLSVSGMLRRTPSVLSKAPSENMSFRGRSQTDFRSMGKSWNSKTRSRPRLYPTSTVASSRTSLDDQSVWSPAGSSTWSRYSYGKTQTSMSMESLGSHFAHGDYQQAIGFANALSQAIIREEGMTIASDEEFTRVAPLLEDETLELTGAPWAKEGILKHKHHLEALDKKAKDRTWNECFAVIEKGYMRLFSFNMNAKSMRQKKSRPSAGGVVGGGNWMDNAEALDSFLLRQTIASALPPPGYSKSRPHVWALSLPTGAVHLFQVGTPDIVREFVSTANYWSARLSKEPLMGGVSNIEYGWGENVINTALIRPESNPSTHGHVPRPSMASSMRSSMDHATGTVKARLPGDKVTLNDWSPPTSSMMASNLMEVDQLRALTDYVKNIEDELARHNEMRAPMLIAFSPRHPNAGKAMANWERKSSYLLREIVKFRTYIDSLTAAQTLKNKIYAEREATEETLDVSNNVDRPSPAKENDGANEALKASKPITT